MTKTWFTTVDSAAKIVATPTGYKLLDHPRPNRTGGRTGIVSRDTLQVKKLAADVLNSFEYSEWNVISGSFRLRLVVVYRPPYSLNHPVTENVFLAKFS